MKKKKLIISAFFLFITFSANITMAQTYNVRAASSGFTEGYITKWSPYSGGYDRISNSAIFQNSSGNIGVGTDNPLFKLDVNGNTNITGNFTNTGTIKTSSFHGFGNGLVLYDTSGKFIPYSFSGNSSQVLLGNGTWGNVPITNDTNKWQFQNGNLFTLTSGNVGVGLNNPQFKLDVYGDVRISENLYVGGGIIISDVVNATDAVNTLRLNTTTMKTSTIKADTIDVDNLKTTGNFTFAGDKVLSYTPTSNGFGNYSFGRTAPSYNTEMPICFYPTTPVTDNLLFGEMLYSWGHRNGNPLKPLNVMSMGFDGSNGIIEVAGTNLDPNGLAPRLLINYKCGKDVFINTGELGGNIQLAGIGKVGIGILPDASSPKLDIFGDVRISVLNEQGSSDFILVTDGSGLIGKKPVTDLGSQIINNIGNQIINNMGDQIHDDLGSHIATKDIILGDNWISRQVNIDGQLKKGLHIDQNGHVYVSGNIECGGADFILGKNDGRPTNPNTGAHRALVHGGWGDKDDIIINYDGDFLDGVHIMAPHSPSTSPSLVVDGKVEINGQIKVTGGELKAGNVLTSDPDGLASWQTPTSWQLTGNSGIGNFIGTNDTEPLVFKTHTTEKMRINENGYVGIGLNTNPTSALFIQGNTVDQSQITINNLTSISSLKIKSNNGQGLFSSDKDIVMCIDNDNSNDDEGFYIVKNSDDIFSSYPNPIRRLLSIKGDETSVFGKFYIISTINGQTVNAKIDNDGFISCRKLTVQITGTLPDFVFDNDYKIPTLYEEEQYYKTNKHLKGIPSAKEVIEKGMDVDKFIASLLEKLETTVIQNVEQQKELDKLKEQVNSLQKQVKHIK